MRIFCIAGVHVVLSSLSIHIVIHPAEENRNRIPHAYTRMIFQRSLVRFLEVWISFYTRESNSDAHGLDDMRLIIKAFLSLSLERERERASDEHGGGE